MKTSYPTSILATVLRPAFVGIALALGTGCLTAADQGSTVATLPKLFTERPAPPSSSPAPGLVESSNVVTKTAPVTERRLAAWSPEIERLRKECEVEEAALLQERVELLRQVAQPSKGAKGVDIAAIYEWQRPRIERLANKKRQVEEAKGRTSSAAPAAIGSTAPETAAAAEVANSPVR